MENLIFYVIGIVKKPKWWFGEVGLLGGGPARPIVFWDDAYIIIIIDVY